jgi:ATP-dependent Clp protease adaptor protein ClpS
MSAGFDDNYDGGISLATKQNVKKPDMYRVLLHNDHYTSMDFVVDILMKIFHMPAARATEIMLDVHRKGIGVCGVYTYDIAVSKVESVHLMAKEKQFPLRCSYEKA